MGPMASKKSAKAKTWQETSTALMETYLKKTRASSGCLIVLNVYGDLVLKTGKASAIDATTIGSLAASVTAAGEGL